MYQSAVLRTLSSALRDSWRTCPIESVTQLSPPGTREPEPAGPPRGFDVRWRPERAAIGLICAAPISSADPPRPGPSRVRRRTP